MYVKVIASQRRVVFWDTVQFVCIIASRVAESSFFMGFRLQPLKSPDSDSGLKSDTNSWTCVIVRVYFVNVADRQILKI